MRRAACLCFLQAGCAPLSFCRAAAECTEKGNNCGCVPTQKQFRFFASDFLLQYRQKVVYLQTTENQKPTTC